MTHISTGIWPLNQSICQAFGHCQRENEYEMYWSELERRNSRQSAPVKDHKKMGTRRAEWGGS